MTVADASVTRTRAERWLLDQLPNPRRVLIATVPALAIALTWLVVHTGTRHLDLEVYRIGVQTWLDGGDIYGSLPTTSEGIALPFIYPPFAALLMVPLTVVPMAVAWVMLLGLSVLSLGVTFYVVARRLWPSGGRGAALSASSIALPLSFGLEPVLQTFEFGQINLLLMALVAVDCLVDRPRWPRGMLIGIAAAVKLTPAVFLLFFLLRRDFRAALVTVASGALATVIGFVVAPAMSWTFWLNNPTAGVSGSPFFSNQTFQVVLVRAGVEGTASRIIWLVLSIGLLVLALPAISRAPAPLALVATAGFGLLVSPTSWSHHWVWVAPALLVLVATAWRLQSRAWAGVAAATGVVFVIAPHQLGLPRSGEVELTWTPLQQVIGSTYVWFTTVLYVLLWVVWRKRRPATEPADARS